MLAYKFTGPDGTGVFSGFRWPVPSGGSPGAWVRVEDEVDACVAGVHACTVAQVPYWLAPEMWEIDLAVGELREAGLHAEADAALAATSTAELGAVAEAVAGQATPLVARLIGYAVDACGTSTWLLHDVRLRGRDRLRQRLDRRHRAGHVLRRMG